MRLVEYWITRLLLAVFSWFPKGRAKLRIWFCSSLLDLAIPRLRRIARRNLELAGFSNRDEIIDGVFRSIARLIIHFARLPRMNRTNIQHWIRYERPRKISGRRWPEVRESWFPLLTWATGN